MQRKELIMKKRVVSLALVIALLSCLSVPVSASSPAGEEALPPWVEDGETWFPVGDIMPLEYLGYCPEGHMAPEGYKLEGYTMGETSYNFDDVSRICALVSVFTGKWTYVQMATGAAAVLFDWLDAHEGDGLIYFKYVYTREGRLPYNHIIYTVPVTNTRYDYVSCETHYGVSHY
jgi:hypothetical protein